MRCPMCGGEIISKKCIDCDYDMSEDDDETYEDEE